MKRNNYISRSRSTYPRAVRWKRVMWAVVLILALPKLALVFSSVVNNDSTTSLSVSQEDDFAERRKRDTALEGTIPSLTVQDVSVLAEEGAVDVPESVLEQIVRVARGDTLMGILLDAGLCRIEAHAAVSALQEVYNPRELRPGDEVVLTFRRPAGLELDEDLFEGLRVQVDVDRNVMVLREGDEDFSAVEEQWELEVKQSAVQGEIESSLYAAAMHSGMPSAVLIQMIRALSFDVDFQRDIHPGDRFEALFEQEVDDQGQALRQGPLLFANLETSGRSLRIYRYTALDGEVDYFNAQGQSVRKTLMLTPIDGARLSSGYGMRRHPILGYSRMHRGLDFAAAKGTPIMAAGDGIITHAGRKGNYGITVQLRHPNEYTTLYAHMSRLGKGIKKGGRVKQGEVIGYVGSTGMSTGPHLHYEVHLRGKHVNPAAVNSPPGRTLAGNDLKLFKKLAQDVEARYASLAGKVLAGEPDPEASARLQ